MRHGKKMEGVAAAHKAIAYMNRCCEIPYGSNLREVACFLQTSKGHETVMCKADDFVGAPQNITFLICTPLPLLNNIE